MTWNSARLVTSVGLAINTLQLALLLQSVWQSTHSSRLKASLLGSFLCYRLLSIPVQFVSILLVNTLLSSMLSMLRLMLMAIQSSVSMRSRDDASSRLDEAFFSLLLPSNTTIFSSSTNTTLLLRRPPPLLRSVSVWLVLVALALSILLSLLL